MREIFRRIYHFLGSLFLAMVLLPVIGGILAWGTFYELQHGTAAVQRFVYQAGWFQGLLAFLALNLALAASHRYPWKKKHLPFLLAHLGIIGILIGGIVGGIFGIEGQLVIPEGRTEQVLTLPTKVFAIYEPNPGNQVIFPSALEATAWIHEPNLELPVSLKDRQVRLVVDRYYPDAQVSEEVRPGDPSDPAMVRLILAREGEEQEIWLRMGDPDRSAASWADTRLFFLAISQEELVRLSQAEPTGSERGELSIAFPQLEVTARIPVPETLGEPIPIEGTPYTVTFKAYFSDFALTETGPVNRSSWAHNPAVGLVLSGPEGEDPYLLFALHPEFQEVHGITHRIPVQLLYTHSASLLFPPHTFGILMTPSGSLAAVATGRAGQRRWIPSLVVGQRTAHPWDDYEMEVAQFLPHARVAHHFTNRSNQVRREALYLRAQEGEETAEGWLQAGGFVDLNLGEKVVRVEYRAQRHPLPFSIKLLDFRRVDYPGTQIAQGYESDVELSDPERGIVLTRTIRMNNPLKYRGYTLFQSSYIEGPVQATVLLVRNDPGTPLVYAGFLIVIGGVVSMFSMRRPKERAQ